MPLPEFLVDALKTVENSTYSTGPVKVIISEHLEEYYREAYGDHFFDNIEVIRPQRISKFAEFVFSSEELTED